MDQHPIQGEQQYSQSLVAIETVISSGSVGQFGPSATLPIVRCIENIFLQKKSRENTSVKRQTVLFLFFVFSLVWMVQDHLTESLSWKIELPRGKLWGRCFTFLSYSSCMESQQVMRKRLLVISSIYQYFQVAVSYFSYLQIDIHRQYKLCIKDCTTDIV